MFQGYLDSSILAKSIAADLNRVHLVNIRDFAVDKHRTCDDAPYGGGPGMLLKPEPLEGALDAVEAVGKRTVYLTPSGGLYKQSYCCELSKENELVIICGHYEGIDQRIIDFYVNDEISIGDYIMFSGEVAAMVLLDSLARLGKGVIKAESIENESFAAGMLEYPQYTRPRKFRSWEVPEVLVSGNHAEIENWRLKKSLEKTAAMRPGLLKSRCFTDQERKILRTIEQEEKKNGPIEND